MRPILMKARTRPGQNPVLTVRAVSRFFYLSLLTAPLLLNPVFLGVVIATSGADINRELTGRTIERPVLHPALSSLPPSFSPCTHGGPYSTR
jgi:hypothetical protein